MQSRVIVWCLLDWWQVTFDGLPACPELLELPRPEPLELPWPEPVDW
jgi:hypothetical protein